MLSGEIIMPCAVTNWFHDIRLIRTFFRAMKQRTFDWTGRKTWPAAVAHTMLAARRSLTEAARRDAVAAFKSEL
jgi:hypothetical protein